MEKFMKYTKEQDDNHKEQQRLEGQHEVCVYHMGKPVYAPVVFSKPGLRILDSGCANGRWLRDLQSSSPAKHEYFGTDIDESLYPSPPPEGMHFQNQSIKEEFPTEWNNSFDLIHQRFVMAGGAPNPPASVVEKLAKLHKPGGWMQLIELNMEPDPNNGPMLQQFIRMLREICAAIGMGENLANDMTSIMGSLSLIDVQQKEVFMAHGATIEDKELMEKSIVSPVSAVEPILQEIRAVPNNFSEAELDGFEGRFRKELEERGGHTTVLVVWGRKPSE